MKLKLMSSLFESFDPMINQYLAMNWLIIMMMFMLLPNMFWVIPCRLNFLWVNLVKLIYKEFKLIITNKYQSNILLFISLMIYILLFNLLGLFPYIFTITSHMSLNLSLSLSLWMGIMIYLLKNMLNEFLIHLVPLNTPYMLMHFMVLIELVSNLIRPWTLAIRLSANLVAGHLLLILLGIFMNKINFLGIMFMIFLQNLLMILELSMSFIQAYVFSILSLLYFFEAKC